MLEIPKIPPKEELEYREKHFMTSLFEQWQRVSKQWIWGLVAAVVLAYPVVLLAKKLFANYFVAHVIVDQAKTDQYPNAKALQLTKSGILPVTSGVYSVYVQILNPNPEIAARDFSYEVVISGKNKDEQTKLNDHSILEPGASKFVVFPSVKLSFLPETVDATVKIEKWSRYTPPVKPKFEILNKNSGISPEGNFFIDGLLRNTDGFQIKQTDIVVVVFDKSNNNIVAVNSTNIQDLLPEESRYFRLTWPNKYDNIGEVSVYPEVNPFVENVVLPKDDAVPAR